MKRSAHANLLCATLSAAVLVGCETPRVAPRAPAVPPPLSGPEGEVAELDRRVAAGLATQAELVRRAELSLLFDADNRGVHRLLDLAAEAGPLPEEGALLACQLATLERHYAAMEHACLDVVERFTTRAAAEEAAARLSLIFDQTADADARVAKRLWQAAGRCHAAADSACAGLSLHAGRARLTVAAQTKDRTAFRETLEWLGSVRAWRVCGPVATPTATGFREARAQLIAGYPLVMDEEGVCPARRTGEAAIHPIAYSQAGVHWLVSEVYVPKRTRTTLIAQLPGAVHVSVDGEALLSNDLWEHAGGAFHHAGLWLDEGWHRVSVLVGATDVNASVALFFLNENGAPAIDAARPPAQLEPVPSKPLERVSPATAADILLRDLDPDTRPFHALRVATLLSHETSPQGERAREIATAVTRAFPASGLAWLLLASAVGADPTLSPKLRDAEKRRALEATLERRPDELLARFRLATMDFDERPDEALERLRALVSQRPDYPWGQRRLHQMLGQRDLSVAAQGPLEAALRLAPGETSFGFAERYYRRRGMLAQKRAIQEARLHLENAIASPRHAAWLRDEGHRARALAEYDALFALAPDHPGYGVVYEVARQEEGWKGVTTRAQARLQQFPRDAQAAHWLVRAAHAGEDRTELAAALACAESVRAGDPLWERYRHRAERGAVDEVVPFDSRALIATFERDLAAHPELYEGHGHVYVLDAAARIFHQGGGSFMVTHQIVRVQSKDAASQLGEVVVPAGAERRILRVIKADGRVVEPEASHASGDTSLSGIDVGDYVETRTVESQSPAAVDPTFQERFFFASQVPMALSTYTLIAPPEVLAELEIHAVDAPDPKPDSVGDRMRLRYTARGVAAARPEPFAGPPSEKLPHITVTRGVNVQRFARSAANRLAKRERVNHDVTEFARLATAELDSDRARLDALVRAVLGRVPMPGAERDPPTVLATGRGDRFALLRVALNAAGLDARVVGVHRASPLATVDWADQQLSEQFLLVRADGEEVPVTMSGTSVMVGAVLPHLRGGLAVEIDPSPQHLHRLGETLEIPPAWLHASPHTMNIDAALDDRGALHGRFALELSTPLAGALRRWARTTPRPTVNQALEGWLGTIFPGATLEEIDIAPLEDELSPLRVTGTLAAVGYASRTGGALVIDRFLPILSLTLGGGGASPAAYLRVAERRTALYLQPHTERSLVRIKLPAEARVLATPEPFNEDGPFGRIQQSAHLDDGALVVERQISIPFTRVAPDAYPSLRALGERVTTRTHTQLVIPLRED